MSERGVDEHRVEELLAERARRRASEPMGPVAGPGASQRLLEDLRRRRATGGSGARPWWLAAGLAAAAVVLALLWPFGSERDFGALPVEVALLDGDGRPLVTEPAARGPGDSFARPGAVLIEMVAEAPEGSWWVYVYDPRGRLHAAGSGEFDGSREELHTHILDGYAALEAGDSFLSLVVIGARRPIPDLEDELPADVGTGPARRAALAVATEHLEEHLGCSVVVREFVLERRP